MMNYSTSTLSQQPAAASGPNLTQQKSPTSSSSSSSASSRAPALTTAKQLKEEGNRLYMSHRYKEAIDMYTKALEKSPHPVYLTNRALCYLKLQQWNDCVTDCKRSIDLATSSKNTHDSTNHLHHHASSVKPYFYMGQALCELERFDEGIEALQLAHETSKQMNEYYGDEITRSIRNAKRRRWQRVEEKRVGQEVELHEYLKKLMLEDKEKQLREKREDESDIDQVESKYDERLKELSKLFEENDARRRRREVPDYLCGKISFELMRDPVITPSGITYDRVDIEQHLQRVGRFDPVTRQELTLDQLIPNLVMKEVVENFITENDWIDGAF